MVFNLTNSQSHVLPHTHPTTDITGLDAAIQANAVVVSPTAPSNPTAGKLWYNTTKGVFNIYDGANWILVGPEIYPITKSAYDALSAADKNDGRFYLITDNDGTIYVDWANVENKPDIPTAISQLSGNSDNITEGDTHLFMTTAERTKLGNQSGVNTGDQSASDFDIKDLADSTGLRNTWNGKQDVISDLDTIRSGASAGATALQSGDNVSELTNDAGYITNSVNDLANYYKKTETYTRSEIEGLISEFGGFEVLENLPSVDDARTNIIYMKGPIGTGGDRYEEWIVTVNEEEEKVWTKIGETSVDLTNYFNTFTDTSDSIPEGENKLFVSADEKAVWNAKQNAIADLDTIRSNATAGKNASDTIETYGDIVTHDASEFAPASLSNTVAGHTTDISDMQSSINDLRSGKQDMLEAGDNITIEDGVISATDTTYTAGDGIDIDGSNRISIDGLRASQILAGRGLETDPSNNNITIDGYEASVMLAGRGLEEYDDKISINAEEVSEILVGNGLIANEGMLNIDTTIVATQTDVTNLQTAINGKQDTLTAGDNITITDGTISATDTTYTAGTGIDITDGVISNTQTSAEWGNIQGDITDQIDLQTALSEKQDTLVSGTNIKTINGNSLLGEGNVALSLGKNDIVVSTAAPSDNTVLWLRDGQGIVADELFYYDSAIGGWIPLAGVVTSIREPGYDKIWYDTNSYKLKIYDRNSASWKPLSTSDTTYTAGTGLTLTGTEFSADTTVLATKSDLANLGSFEVVETLPAVDDANEKTIYLKGPIGDGNDKYEEWIVTSGMGWKSTGTITEKTASISQDSNSTTVTVRSDNSSLNRYYGFTYTPTNSRKYSGASTVIGGGGWIASESASYILQAVMTPRLTDVSNVVESTAPLEWTEGRQWTLIGETSVDLTNYATTSAMNTALAGKQDTLTAGDNITITNGVIEATDTTYTAGTGITLTGTRFSADTEVLATKSDLTNLGSFEVVETLPEIANANSKTIYIKGPIGEGNDKYEEWIVTEKIGTIFTSESGVVKQTIIKDENRKSQAIDIYYNDERVKNKYVAFDNLTLQPSPEYEVCLYNSSTSDTLIYLQEQTMPYIHSEQVEYPGVFFYASGPASIDVYFSDTPITATTGTIKQWTLIGEASADLSGKQDRLTAGTNITIDANNVISASGGVTIDSTAPSNPSAGQLWYDTTATVKALKVYNGTSWELVGPEIVALTQAQYDALSEAEKNNGKTYIITNASGTLTVDWADVTNKPDLQSKTTTGTGLPTTAPSEVGTFYLDTTNNKLYVGVGTSSTDDWMEVGSGSGGGGNVIALTQAEYNALTDTEKNDGKLRIITDAPTEDIQVDWSNVANKPGMMTTAASSPIKNIQVWVGTQAQYDALETKDPAILYFTT